MKSFQLLLPGLFFVPALFRDIVWKSACESGISSRQCSPLFEKSILLSLTPDCNSLLVYLKLSITLRQLIQNVFSFHLLMKLYGSDLNWYNLAFKIVSDKTV